MERLTRVLVSSDSRIEKIDLGVGIVGAPAKPALMRADLADTSTGSLKRAVEVGQTGGTRRDAAFAAAVSAAPAALGERRSSQQGSPPGRVTASRVADRSPLEAREAMRLKRRGATFTRRSPLLLLLLPFDSDR